MSACPECDAQERRRREDQGLSDLTKAVAATAVPVSPITEVNYIVSEVKSRMGWLSSEIERLQLENAQLRAQLKARLETRLEPQPKAQLEARG